MPDTTRTVGPGPAYRTVRAADGKTMTVPENWELLEPGDAACTRRVKAAGPTWTMQSRKGRRVFSLGIWAPADIIAAVKAELEDERSKPSYAKRLAADRARRDKKQESYSQEFLEAVTTYLRFHPRYREIVQRFAQAVVELAVPVGSGTVARTQRISIEKRAELAVLAWMRHQTTDYDRMKIARKKGERRAVRHQLAQRSLDLLAQFRREVPASEEAVQRLEAALKAPAPVIDDEEDADSDD